MPDEENIANISLNGGYAAMIVMAAGLLSKSPPFLKASAVIALGAFAFQLIGTLLASNDK